MTNNASAQGQSTRVLLIDDETDVCAAYSMLLDMEGMEVMTALNGKDGLIKAKSRVPDVVICDYMMPGMDGLAVCRAIRSDDTLRNVTIILWSAARGVDADGLADLTIEKPVHIDSFAQVIRESIARRRAGPTE
jgi:DNA-binding response OmpR family regulator